MRNLHRAIFILSLYLLATACSPNKIVSEADLKQYITDEEHGLHKQVTKNDTEIEVFYRPAEMVWKNDLESDPEKKRQQLRQIDSLSYFIFHFSRKGKEIENGYVSNPDQFKAVVDYLSFEIYNDLFLLQGKDTVWATDAVYTRTFGSSRGTSVMAVFKANLKNSNGEIKLCFDDKTLGIGLTEFEFDIRDIKNTPTLN